METSAYQLFKLNVLSFVPLSKDAAHVYLGLTIYLGAGFLFRAFKSHKPVLLVFAISCVMEMFDLRDDLTGFGHFRWSASLHDIVNTIFWPLIFSVLIRFNLLGSSLSKPESD